MHGLSASTELVWIPKPYAFYHILSFGIWLPSGTSSTATNTSFS